MSAYDYNDNYIRAILGPLSMITGAASLGNTQSEQFKNGIRETGYQALNLIPEYGPLASNLARTTDIVNNALYNKVAGGYKGGIGTTIHNIQGYIPGGGGPMLSAATGVANRMFGSKINEPYVDRTRQQLNNTDRWNTNASTYNTLSFDIDTMRPDMPSVYKSNVGKDGSGLFGMWKPTKANDTYNDLKYKEKVVNRRIGNKVNDAFTSVTDNALRNNARKFYDNQYCFGGKMFENGGNLFNYGLNFDNGLQYINAGSTHELNPNNGVPISINKQDGQPNLVEEGEVVANGEYVFSNRLKLPDEVARKLGVPRGKTFAEAVKYLSAESEELPNDPIVKQGLEDSIARLQASQERLKKDQQEQQQMIQQMLAQPMADEQQQYADPYGVQDTNQYDNQYENQYAYGGHMFATGTPELDNYTTNGQPDTTIANAPKVIQDETGGFSYVLPSNDGNEYVLPVNGIDGLNFNPETNKFQYNASNIQGYYNDKTGRPISAKGVTVTPYSSAIEQTKNEHDGELPYYATRKMLYDYGEDGLKKLGYIHPAGYHDIWVNSNAQDPVVQALQQGPITFLKKITTDPGTPFYNDVYLPNTMYNDATLKAKRVAQKITDVYTNNDPLQKYGLKALNWAFQNFVPEDVVDIGLDTGLGMALEPVAGAARGFSKDIMKGMKQAGKHARRITNELLPEPTVQMRLSDGSVVNVPQRMVDEFHIDIGRGPSNTPNAGSTTPNAGSVSTEYIDELLEHGAIDPGKNTKRIRGYKRKSDNTFLSKRIEKRFQQTKDSDGNYYINGKVYNTEAKARRAFEQESKRTVAAYRNAEDLARQRSVKEVRQREYRKRDESIEKYNNAKDELEKIKQKLKDLKKTGLNSKRYNEAKKKLDKLRSNAYYNVKKTRDNIISEDDIAKTIEDELKNKRKLFKEEAMDIKQDLANEYPWLKDETNLFRNIPGFVSHPKKKLIGGLVALPSAISGGIAIYNNLFGSDIDENSDGSTNTNSNSTTTTSKSLHDVLLEDQYQLTVDPNTGDSVYSRDNGDGTTNIVLPDGRAVVTNTGSGEIISSVGEYKTPETKAIEAANTLREKNKQKKEQQQTQPVKTTRRSTQQVRSNNGGETIIDWGTRYDNNEFAYGGHIYDGETEKSQYVPVSNLKDWQRTDFTNFDWNNTSSLPKGFDWDWRRGLLNRFDNWNPYKHTEQWGIDGYDGIYKEGSVQEKTLRADPRYNFFNKDNNNLIRYGKLYNIFNENNQPIKKVDFSQPLDKQLDFIKNLRYNKSVGSGSQEIGLKQNRYYIQDENGNRRYVNVPDPTLYDVAEKYTDFTIDPIDPSIAYYNYLIKDTPQNNTIQDDVTASLPQEQTPQPKHEFIPYVDDSLRYAPLGINAMSLINNMRPIDFTPANEYENYARQLGNPISLPVSTIGNYRRRNPFDEEYSANLINQNNASALRQGYDIAGGNRAMQMGSQASRDFATQQQLAQNILSAYQANRTDDAQVSDFNRGTDNTNASIENARNNAQADINANLRAKSLLSLMQAAKYRQDLIDQRDTAIANDLSVLSENLGNIGSEDRNENIRRWLYNTGAMATPYDLLKPAETKGKNKKDEKTAVVDGKNKKVPEVEKTRDEIVKDAILTNNPELLYDLAIQDALDPTGFGRYVAGKKIKIKTNKRKK